MVDFKELLKKPMDEVKPPPVQPAGTWYGTITGHEFKESRFQNDDGSRDPQVSFHIKTTEAGDDVDANDANVYLDRVKNMKRDQTQEFSIDPEGQWALKQFLEGLGIATQGHTADVLIPQTTGAQVMYSVEHSQGKGDKADRTYANVKRVVARS